MADDYHPLDRRPNPERIDLGAIKADLEFLIRAGRAVPQGAGPQTALHDDRKCRLRHRMDGAFPTRSPKEN